METNIVYADDSKYRRLTTEQKKFAVMIKKEEKIGKISLVNGVKGDREIFSQANLCQAG